MASAATTLRISITLGNSSSDRIFAGQPISRTNVVLPRHSSSSSGRSSSVLTFWRRRTNRANSPLTSSNKKKKSMPRKDIEEDEDEDEYEDEDEDEDAFEKLFQLLEEDLKNDDLSKDNDEISEEDLATFERELAEALKDDELHGELDSIADEENEDDDEDEEVVAEDDDIDEEEMPVKLKNWQLKRLAYAMKKGRRKTQIKDLAADLCLDRAVVLELLRNPPPSLLLLSAALPDEPKPRMIGPETQTQEIDPVERSDVTIPEANVEEPIHVMQSRWSAQKRVKKVQLETLERVYRRSKRPTNAMINSLVNVTNLPRRRVLQWFEERRSEEGVPDRRIPYEPTV